MQKTLQTYGSIIRHRRELLGLSQHQLAEHSGVNLRTIQHVEKGEGNPTIETLLQLTGPLGLVLELRLKPLEY